jgi:opacity protein-like surface antigen
MRVDVLGGGRYWDLEQNVRIGPVSGATSKDWIDPFIGARLLAQVNDWLGILIRADIGGFAVSSSASELTWNVFAGPMFTLSDGFAIVVGYRWLDLDRESVNYETDVTLSGLQMAAQFSF